MVMAKITIEMSKDEAQNMINEFERFENGDIDDDDFIDMAEIYFEAFATQLKNKYNMEYKKEDDDII